MTKLSFVSSFPKVTGVKPGGGDGGSGSGGYNGYFFYLCRCY